MINNLGAARPLQSGLQDAMIIYEMIVEGGLTRYMAVFQDQNTERIGSIRSARHYFLDYALENDAIYVHHGNSPQAAADFKTLNIDRISVDASKTGWRDKSLNVSTEHTLFTSIAKLNNGVGNKRKTRNKDFLLNYSETPIDLSTKEGAIKANNIEITYSGSVKTSYEYDESAQNYKRSVNGKAHTDYVTKKQYTFKNIITYQVSNTSLNDGSGKDRQTLDNIGSGEGYYITNGYAVPITWSKSSRSSQTVYKYKDGTEIDVNDGNTFIQIQPKGKNLIIN
jgi:thiol:disulfide interchange protein